MSFKRLSRFFQSALLDDESRPGSVQKRNTQCEILFDQESWESLRGESVASAAIFIANQPQQSKSLASVFK
jgi:hypothetical protein